MSSLAKITWAPQLIIIPEEHCIHEMAMSNSSNVHQADGRKAR